ncbi:c-type cytochrome biogenesis protein CcmI [Ramlibacter sp.]|uniref:c-type cytochrome biogenesis protein CcmI n=1 Tax=Ramlibacter sp. TaxID=1917967 RepID=UPI003D106604
MTGQLAAFVVVAALLVVMALGVLLRSLLRGGSAAPLADDSVQSNLHILRAQLRELDDELAAGSLDTPQHAAARTELERRVLDETAVPSTAPRATRGRKSAIALALALPLAATVLYAHLGSRDALNPAVVAGSAAPTPAMPALPVDMEAALQTLAERLKAEPDNVEGWALLGRSLLQLDRAEPARDAFAQALRHRGNDAGLLVDYADALARVQGRNLAGEPETLLQRALAIDPDHGKALALAGAAAMARKDHDAALAHWTRLRARLPPDTPMVQDLDTAIDRARAAKGLPPLAEQSASRAPAAPAAAAADRGALRVTVTVAPELAAKVHSGDTLFVFARAAEGPRVPLAVSRQTLSSAPKAPIQVQLDDSLAMTPQAKLSTASRVVVAARISRSGTAAPDSGDLEARDVPAPPHGELAVVIDRVRP